MLNILFVDDEPNVLSGLKRMLYSMRNEWEMSFASGGEEALRLMDEANFDVVVSDMKMPGMDGAELLKRVRDKFPETVRMVLSGFAESEMIMRSIGAAHQYMAKPCEPDKLKLTVERACSIHEMLTDPALRKMVTQLRNVPSLPSLYLRLMDEMDKEDPSIKVIGRIVEQDIGMTAKILQIVNSAFYGLNRSVSDTTQAVRLLGLETIGSLVLGLGVFSKFESGPGMGNRVQNLWHESMTVATLAKGIAKMENSEIANDAFSARMLHDVGRLVIAYNMPEQNAKAEELSERLNITIKDAEKTLIGTSHTQVGAYLLNLWGLPRSIVEAAAFHHDPSSYQDSQFTCLTAVHAAVAFLSSENNPDERIDFDMKYLGDLGLADRIEAWRPLYEQLRSVEPAEEE